MYISYGKNPSNYVPWIERRYWKSKFISAFLFHGLPMPEMRARIQQELEQEKQEKQLSHPGRRGDRTRCMADVNILRSSLGSFGGVKYADVDHFLGR